MKTLISVLMIFSSLSTFAYEGIIAEPRDIELIPVNGFSCSDRLDIKVSGFHIRDFVGYAAFSGVQHSYDPAEQTDCLSSQNWNRILEYNNLYRGILDDALEEGKRVKILPENTPESRIILID
ncbi:MAG: hypothetical protein CME64_16040 [Halobacteriovoraceae bacterium]|nr:hypothetical protein [Halobacteriovoraceae bacterium]